MREIEVKGVVPDERACRDRLIAAGARLVFEGALEDRRYDTPQRTLFGRDHVLRLRTERRASEARASLDWKGAATISAGYKERIELSASTTDPDAMSEILRALGYVVMREVDREVAVYDLDGTVVRFERYPRMDTLAEIEGTPPGIERVIAVLELSRGIFTTDRLSAFVARYEARTGSRAAVSRRELGGDYRFDISDA